jgi:hypothetical protein
MQDVALAPAPQPQPATVQPEPFEASPEPLTEILHLQDEAFARYNNTLWAGDAVVVD